MDLNRSDRPWEGCPPGGIRQLGFRLRHRRRNRRLTKVVTLTSALLLTLLIGGYAGVQALKEKPDDGFRDYQYAGLKCSDVEKTMASLEENESLPPDHRDAVRQHIADCPHCHERYESLLFRLGQHVPKLSEFDQLARPLLVALGL